MKYLIGALVILALLFLVWWFVSKGKKRQLDEQRSEAARIRAGAEEHDATIRGQEAFVQQADERASFARQEAEERARQAEESAREAQRVQDEASRHQEELDRARLARDAQLRRADEIDPDVEVAEGDPRPLPEDLDDDVRSPDSTRDHTPDTATRTAEAEPETRVHTPVPAAQSDTSVRERQHADPVVDSEPLGSGASASEPVAETDRDQDRGSWGAGAAATGASAAAIGSAYAATRGDVTDDEAARLASGVDYSDHREGDSAHSADSVDSAHSEYEPAHAADSTRGDEWGTPAVDEGTWTTQDTERTDITGTTDRVATDGTTHDAQPTVGSDRVDLEERQGHDMSEHDDTTRSDASDASDATQNREATTQGQDTTPSGEGEMAIISDIEDYASTEPLPMDGQTPSGNDDTSDASRDDDLRQGSVTTDSESDADTSTTRDDSVTEEPTTEENWESDATSSGSDSTTDSSTDSSTDSLTDSGTESRSDSFTDSGTESRSDSGDADLNAGVDAGSSASSDTADDNTSAGDEGVRTEGGDASHWPDGTDRVNTLDSDSVGDERQSADFDGSHDESATTDHSAEAEAPESESGSAGDGSGRRMSGVDEIRDGGFGVGSAAPFEDRAQPADHPVQAYNDTRTFRVPGSAGYDSAEPDVWFYDEEAARRAGFNPSEG